MQLSLIHIYEDQSSMYVLLKEKKKHTNKEIKKEILKKTKKCDCEVEVQESSMDMSALGGSGISVQIKGCLLYTSLCRFHV